MTAFLWCLIVFGLIEIGTVLNCLHQGRWPERTKGGLVIALVLWAGIAGWAIYLL